MSIFNTWYIDVFQGQSDGLQSPTDSTRSRSLRRTVSVPSDGQFPDQPPEGAPMPGKTAATGPASSTAADGK